jgi:hypothetical protein
MAGVAGSGLSPSLVHARALPVRARATVIVEIGSRLYRAKLDGDANRCGPRCSTLSAALTGSAEGIFKARYGFVDWRDRTEQSSDTIVVRLREKPIGGHIEIVVVLHGRSRALAPDSVVSQFEDFFEAQGRAASFWDPTRLQQLWSDLIDRRLDASSARVIPLVIGRLPVTAAVSLPGPDSASRVDVSADSLRAAGTPATEFLVRVEIEETKLGTLVKRQGELKLMGCEEGRGGGRKRYVCQKMEFSVVSPQRVPGDYSALLATRARITAETLHIYTYSAQSVASSGIVAVGNP